MMIKENDDLSRQKPGETSKDRLHDALWNRSGLSVIREQFGTKTEQAPEASYVCFVGVGGPEDPKQQAIQKFKMEVRLLNALDYVEARQLENMGVNFVGGNWPKCAQAIRAVGAMSEDDRLKMFTHFQRIIKDNSGQKPNIDDDNASKGNYIFKFEKVAVYQGGKENGTAQLWFHSKDNSWEVYDNDKKDKDSKTLKIVINADDRKITVGKFNEKICNGFSEKLAKPEAIPEPHKGLEKIDEAQKVWIDLLNKQLELRYPNDEKLRTAILGVFTKQYSGWAELLNNEAGKIDKEEKYSKNKESDKLKEVAKIDYLLSQFLRNHLLFSNPTLDNFTRDQVKNATLRLTLDRAQKELLDAAVNKPTQELKEMKDDKTIKLLGITPDAIKDKNGLVDKDPNAITKWYILEYQAHRTSGFLYEARSKFTGNSAADQAARGFYLEVISNKNPKLTDKDKVLLIGQLYKYIDYKNRDHLTDDSSKIAPLINGDKAKRIKGFKEYLP